MRHENPLPPLDLAANAARSLGHNCAPKENATGFRSVDGLYGCMKMAFQGRRQKGSMEWIMRYDSRLGAELFHEDNFGKRLSLIARESVFIASLSGPEWKDGKAEYLSISAISDRLLVRVAKGSIRVLEAHPHMIDELLLRITPIIGAENVASSVARCSRDSCKGLPEIMVLRAKTLLECLESQSSRQFFTPEQCDGFRADFTCIIEKLGAMH